VRRLEASILNHEFEKARFYSDEEETARAGLRALREKLGSEESKAIPQVTAADVERVISHWTGITLEGIKKTLRARQK
jgi:ATP-dependent Clp protease ATP-binding subunit ClpC